MSCSCKVGETCMNFPFNFYTPVSIEKIIDVEETAHGVAVVEGTLLAEGLSKNKNWYEIAEMKKIAESAVGVPIYYGTMTKINPNTGLLTKNMHANVIRNRIGKIIRTVFDKTNRVIKFWAEIVNTKNFPTIIQEVKKGWGISIGGVAHNAKWVMKKIGKIKRMVLKVKDMVVNHVQLISPTTKRGQQKAKVDNVAIQETLMEFNELPPVNLHITIIQKGEQAYIIKAAHLE